jgi:DNA polymerase I-like protein with 3'-5' exonuclease and polymerase domains
LSPHSLPSFLQRLDPNIFLGDNYVVLDFETDTSHGDYGSPVHPDNHLLLARWKVGPGGTVKSKWGGEFEQQELLDDIAKADFIVAHNAKYELGWLRRCGIDLRKVLAFDTKMAEYVLLGNRASGDENMRPLSTSLDMACRRRGLPIKDPVVDIMIKNGMNPVYVPRPWLSSRCKQDVETTEKVFLDQREHMRKLGLLPVQYTRCLLTPLLADIETEGMALNLERVKAEFDKATVQMQDLQKRMDAMTGGINWRSSKQVAEFVYDSLKFSELRKPNGEPKRNAPTERAPHGTRLTDQKTMALLTATTAAQREFVDLRKDIGKVNALLTKNLAFFMGVCNEYDGVFYAELNQMATATHRLSSTGIELVFETIRNEDGKPSKKKVQFQNVPRKLKKLFRAKRKTADGRPYLMFDPDGSQLEFRVAVLLGLLHDFALVRAGLLDQSDVDWQGLKDIEDPDWDAHVTSAAAMEQMPYAELYALYKAGDEKAVEARQNAKPETFKPLYGGRKGTKKQERWYKEFRARYPGIARWQEANINKVVETNKLVTEWGMRYYWPYAKRDRNGYVNVTTAVCNYPVQALATAEIIPIALVYLWHRIGVAGLDEFMRIVNTVHDSAPTEVHPDYVDHFRTLAKDAFTTDVYKYVERVYGIKEFPVPLGVGLKYGEHLGEGTEESYNRWKDGKEVRVK